MRATRRSTGPSLLPVAGRGSPRARRTPAHHRPDPSCGPTGPRRRGGPRVPGRRPERAHPAGARGPGPPGGRPLEPGDRPCPRRHAADRRRSHRAHHGQAHDVHAHPGGGTGRTGRPLRTVCAGARPRGGAVNPRGGAVKQCDPGLVRLQEELADVGTRAEGLNQRAEEVLEALGRILPFDAGWLAIRDPERRRHVPLATTGAAEPLRRYFESPGADAEVEHLGLNSAQSPVLASELPGPLPEICAWGEYLLPAGFRGGVAGALFASTGRQVGFLSLLAEDPARPNMADRQILAAVTRVIADDLDRTQEIARIARIVGTAEAGVVLTRGGDTLPLPGLPDHRLLAPDSPILAAATHELSGGGPYTTFLAQRWARTVNGWCGSPHWTA